MGFGLSPRMRTHFACRVVVPVAAPSDVVFKVLCDVEKHPNMSPNVEKVELLNNVDIPKVGSKWEETRTFRGKPFILIKTVRELSVNAAGTSFMTDVAYGNTDRWETRNATETATFSVEPMEDEPKCSRLIMTLSYVADGIEAFIMSNFVCGYFVRKVTKKYLQQELEYFALEAQNRYQESIAKSHGLL